MLETRWHFIRHAPVDNPESRVYGDAPANTADTVAFEALAGRLPSDVVTVVSHLRRTHQTLAAIRAADLVIPDPMIDNRFAEQDFGDWAGLTFVEIQARHGNTYNRYWLTPLGEQAPNGESFLDMVARVHAGMEALSRRFAGRDILCVAHGGSIRAALALALDITPENAVRFATDNLSTTLIDRLHPEPGFTGAWRVRGTNIPAR